MQQLQATPHEVLFEPPALPAVTVITASGDDVDATAAPTGAVGSATLVLLVTEAQVAGFAGREEAPNPQPGRVASPLDSWDESSKAALFAIHSHSFEGKQGQAMPPLLLRADGGDAPPRPALLLGLGKPPLATRSWGDTPLHSAGLALAAAAKSHGLQSVTVPLRGLTPLLATAGPAGAGAGEDAASGAAAAVAAFVDGAITGLYEGNVRYKSKPAPKAKLKSITLVAPAEAAAATRGGAPAAALVAAAAKGLALARARLLARFLVEAPPNVCTPSHLARAAAHIAAAAPDRFDLKVLDEAECLALGMRLFVGVGRGSDEPLKLVHLTYNPPGEVTQKIALVGKGLTFDSGGYNIKTLGGIELMKLDMGGAAAVLGAARALAELQPEGIQVHFITASCENMVSGRATRPGDVHLSAAGLTVEVNDTDAEGRLTLADAIWYAQEQAGAKTVVDIATLTGAASVAMGHDTAALFSNSDDLAADLDAAGRGTGEKLWRLPLNQGLRSKLDSPVADLKNYAGRLGGAITAALFLNEFVAEGTDWAHLDIAGPAWDEAAGLPTGFGAAALAEWLLARRWAGGGGGE